MPRQFYIILIAVLASGPIAADDLYKGAFMSLLTNDCAIVGPDQVCIEVEADTSEISLYQHIVSGPVLLDLTEPLTAVSVDKRNNVVTVSGTTISVYCEWNGYATTETGEYIVYEEFEVVRDEKFDRTAWGTENCWITSPITANTRGGQLYFDTTK